MLIQDSIILPPGYSKTLRVDNLVKEFESIHYNINAFLAKTEGTRAEVSTSIRVKVNGTSETYLSERSSASFQGSIVVGEDIRLQENMSLAFTFKNANHWFAVTQVEVFLFREDPPKNPLDDLRLVLEKCSELAKNESAEVREKLEKAMKLSESRQCALPPQI